MTGNIKALIVEDEPNAQNHLIKILEVNFKEIDIVGTCETIKDASETIKASNPDLILMDIALKDGNAFEILKNFPQNTFEIIFITAHDEFMKRAFEHFAFTYLSKPFEDDTLIYAIKHFLLKRKKIFNAYRLELLNDYLRTNGNKFLIHTGSEHIAIKVDDVVHCKSDGNYTKFFFSSGKELLASNPIKYYEALLNCKGFFRMNRFDLINMAHVKSIYKKEAVILSNGMKISITSRNKIKLAELMENFMS